MKEWINKASELLNQSLNPLRQELNEIDWKSQVSENSKALSKHISAFANHNGGGYFVFGIDNKTGSARDINQEECEEIVNKITNLARDAVEPAIIVDSTCINYEGKNLLIIAIFESLIKPVKIRGKSVEESYIRSGGTSRKASQSELGILLLNSENLVWEKLRASEALAPEQIVDLLDYRTLFKIQGRPAPTDINSVIEWMKAKQMVANEQNGQLYITNYGAISTAYELSSFKGLGRKAVRIIRYKGNNKVDTLYEKEGIKGYAIGFEGMIDYLKAMLPQSEVIQEAFRAQVSMYPEIALRELIANAIIHQDFSITGAGPMIEVFDNRVEIRNPGRLLESKRIDRLIGTNPESRNETLASEFRQLNICEERGTGFLKTIAAIEVYGLPPLGFEEGSNYFKVTIHSPKSFAEMSTSERRQACYQHAMIKYYSDSAMTNSSLRERFKMPERQRAQISKLIRETMDAGQIKLKDPDNRSTKFNEYIPYFA